MPKVNIEKEWAAVLADYFETEKFKKLTDFVREEYKSKKIYPKPENLFSAFFLTPFSKVKVVILGQDPYHRPNQAHGLCFSVPRGVPVPPSLKNIYKEIEKDCGIRKDFNNGNLESWAGQGVFLFNAILSVVADKAASHQKIGWEDFSDMVIKTLSDKKDHLVFILWGNYARSKKNIIDEKKHLILEAPHPSPLSAYSGFFNSKHFSKCNYWLKARDKSEIKW